MNDRLDIPSHLHDPLCRTINFAELPNVRSVQQLVKEASEDWIREHASRLNADFSELAVELNGIPPLSEVHGSTHLQILSLPEILTCFQSFMQNGTAIVDEGTFDQMRDSILPTRAFQNLLNTLKNTSVNWRSLPCIQRIFSVKVTHVLDTGMRDTNEGPDPGLGMEKYEYECPGALQVWVTRLNLSDNQIGIIDDNLRTPGIRNRVRGLLRFR